MRTLLPLLLLVSCWGALSLVGESAVVKVKDSPSVNKENGIESVPEMEKRLKKLVNSGVKIAMPFMMEVITEMKLNQTCMQGLFLLLRGVMDIKDWAVKMVDAMGKPSAGVLEGTPIAMGDYDECLGVQAPKKIRPPPIPPYTEEQIAFRGQYCIVQINIPETIRQAAMEYQVGNRSASELANSKTFLRNFVKIAPIADVVDLRLGVCIPSVCNAYDLEVLVTEFSSKVKLETKIVRCEMQKETEYGADHIVILCGIGLLAILISIGTVTELVIRFKNPNQDADTILDNAGTWVKSATAFSFPRNVRKLICFDHTDCVKISSIRGMKFLSICLYIVVWTYATPLEFHFLKFRSAFYFFQFMKDWWFSVFANGSVGADTLILIAGLQVSYRFWWKNVEKDIIFIPKFMLKWYTRFTLSQGLVICLVLCLSLMGTGPLWGDVVTPTIRNCQQRWWMNVLGINNFWPSEYTCLPHTWLVCCLLHMVFVGAILLFILSKSLSFGIIVSVTLILGSSIAIAIVTLMNDLPPAPAYYFLSFVNIKYIWENVFVQAYDHIGSFCIGILLGYFLSHHHELQFKKTTVVFGWCATIVCNLAILCGLYGYHNGEPMARSLSAIYAAVHRPAWSVGISWIVIACAYGYGGCVSKILSWKVLIICDRLSNLTYLLHPLILLLHEGQLRENMYMGHLDQVMYATACIVFTIVIAAVCYITCVAPFQYFEKKFWYYEKPAKKNIANISETPKKKLKHRNSDIVTEKGKVGVQQNKATYKQRLTTLFNT